MSRFGITDKFWSCARKVKYNHLSTAMSASHKMQLAYNRGFEVYKCRYCDGYHLASKKPNKPKIINFHIKNKWFEINIQI